MNTDITKQMEMVLYSTEDDNVTVSALIKDETIWLTQKAMAELFGIDKSGISRHLSKIFESGELDESLVVAKIATPNPHGKTADNMQYSPTNYYNLDAIISVGYRVNSIQATKFRIWATNILKEYMIKIPISHIVSMLPYRTNFIMPLPAKLRLKSFISERITQKKI